MKKPLTVLIALLLTLSACSAPDRVAPRSSHPPITRAQFNRLEKGMRYMDVIKILGSDGERISEAITGRFSARVNYRWIGSDGSIVDIVFRKGTTGSGDDTVAEAAMSADSITGLHIPE